MIGISQKYIVIKERVEIYKDFSINLVNYIIKYYIDYESMNSDEDIRNHYNWCFNKVCDEFLLEDINFKDNKNLREYFYSYYYHQFYNAQNNPDSNLSIEYFENFWNSIFDVNKLNNKNIINVLIEIYVIFNKSIEKNEKTLEIA